MSYRLKERSWFSHVQFDMRYKMFSKNYSDYCSAKSLSTYPLQMVSSPQFWINRKEKPICFYFNRLLSHTSLITLIQRVYKYSFKKRTIIISIQPFPSNPDLCTSSAADPSGPVPSPGHVQWTLFSSDCSQVLHTQIGL